MTKLSLYFKDIKLFDKIKEDIDKLDTVDRVYVNYEDIEKVNLTDFKKQIYILFNHINFYDTIKCYSKNNVLLGDYGLFNYFSEKENTKIFLDYSMNIFNNQTVKFYEDKIEGFTFSPELNFRDICNIRKNTSLKTEILGYGRILLMTSRYLSRDNLKTDDLKDRLDTIFPVKYEKDFTEIYNSKILYMANYIEDIIKANIDLVRLQFIDENEEEALDIINTFNECILNNSNSTNKPTCITTGNYFRDI